MKRSLAFISIICAICGSSFAGSRSSANYSIPTDTIDAGGLNAQSANYSLRGSAAGEFGAAGSSASYDNSPGYAGQVSDLLTLAASRMVHGAAGTFDINLPLGGAAGIESRNGPTASAYTVVFTFANTLTSVASVNATATGGIQPGPSNGSIDPNDAHNYIANLTGVPNAQHITVTLGNVRDSDGNFSSAVPAVMGLLLGDTNGNGAVNASDIGQTKANSGQAANASNFRTDVTANGSINTSDIGLVKLKSGTQLP